MEQEKEYLKAQKRANPVFMTAKTAICLMAKAGVPDAEAVFRAMGLENNEPLQGMADEETILGNALVVEAKYRVMCRLIEESGCQTCVDLPCGFTPKALLVTKRGVRFVGLDLPVVIQEAAPIMKALAAYPERMSFYEVDATNYASLEKALQGVKEPVCITTEGMMMYFSEDEAEQVIANISRLLERLGGCWITPDPEFILQFFGTFRAVFGESSTDKLTSSKNTAEGQSDVGKLGNSFIVRPEDVPGSLHGAERLLEKYGLKAEKINLGEKLPELALYRELSPGQTGRFKEAMGKCHYWRISSAKKAGEQEGAEGKQRPFAMSYALGNGVFELSLKGRLDSISAPELLMAWEREGKGRAVEQVKIDCGELEYISSAGIRVLMAMQENCHQGIAFSHAGAKVAGILQRNGF